MTRRNGRRPVPGNDEFERFPEHVRQNYGVGPYYPLNVVCTDRGQHDRVLITMVRITREGAISLAAPKSTTPGKVIHASGGSSKLSSYEVPCPHCTRRPRIEVAKLARFVSTISAGHVADLDISALE